MPRTISDEEDRWIKQQIQTVQFIESIYNDPALNAEAKALIKKKYPNINIPDLDIRNEVKSMLDADRQARETVEKEKRQQEEERQFTERRTATQQKYGFTDEAMKDLEKLMVERNVGDYEVAASFLAAQNPKPSDTGFDDNRWNHAKQDGFKEIAADPEAWGRAEILKALRNDQERAANQRF